MAQNKCRADQVDRTFREHIAWTSDHPIGLEVTYAAGPFIQLSDGTEVIDLISGIAVSSIGHRHPRVLHAIREQIERHLHVMVYGEFVQQSQVAFANLLTDQLPDTLQVVYYTMSGTEANEGALKLAKKFTGRRKMIAFEGSYHGDTHGSLSVTGRRVYRDPFEPLLPDVQFLPFGDLEALHAIDDRTACVITEPIQGEGGVIVPDTGWIRALRERCSEVGALLIFDEIQTGFGRTGTLFAFEGFGVVPDIITLAKAMAGGMPLGAFVSSAEIMASFRTDPPLSHVTTFGGHPVSCAAARAALEVILEESLTARSGEVGRRVRTALEGRPHVREVRGRGAMLGLALDGRQVTQSIVDACLKQGVLLGWTLHSNDLIRIAPPLNIPFSVLEDALAIMISVLDDVTIRPIPEAE
ncbi:MAG: aspartate aminotransferase family protein [Rhodothermia bacterium]|nr:aspartate aminotransferase family protein [Rhodothermia bacterium]